MNRRRRMGIVTRLLPVLAAVLGALSFLALSDGGRRIRQAEPLMVQIDKIAERLGFGLEQASVSGHRMSNARDILDALGMSDARSLIRFDSAMARSRIERLPWIAEARVTTLWPHRVAVEVRERTPFAIWRRNDGDVLVDREGRSLAPVRRGGISNLLILSGDGAPSAASALVEQLERYRAIAPKVVAASWVAGRRWSLKLANGTAVDLPEKSVDAALERITEGQAGRRLMDLEVGSIDLRLPSEPRVRHTSGDRRRPQS